MDFQFTAAAQRVLDYAAGWIDPAVSPDLDSRAVLLGLLSETECRAAHLLAEHGITIQEVCETLDAGHGDSPATDCAAIEARRFNRDFRGAIREAYRFALQFERSPILATEHLLLAVLYSRSATTQWLNDRGATRHAVEADIRARNGYDDTPLDFEDEEDQGRGERGERTTEWKGGRGKVEGANCKFEIANFKLQNEQDECSDKRPTTNDQRSSPPSPFPLPPSSLLRILDAAANRAREGLRVVEDFLRFVLDDRFLTETAKQLRHDLVAALKNISSPDLFASRETLADVGTGLTTAAESDRADLAGVLAANFARLQESLRSLEEYGKLIDAAMAADFKQIRYRIYTLERAAVITRQNVERLAGAKLYVLIDGRNSLDEFRAFASSLIAAGVHILQLRDKTLDDRQLLTRAQMLRQLTWRAEGFIPSAFAESGATAGLSSSAGGEDSATGSPDCSPIGAAKPQEAEAFNGESSCACGTPIDKLSGLPGRRPLFIMNDRPDLAALAQADGVHLGQEELTVKDARTILGPRALIGASTHSIEQARQAVLDGASYIGVGPTFPSTTKDFASFPGLDLLRAVAAEIRLPAFAIGGITLENLPAVLATGIPRVAVSGAIASAEEPPFMARQFLDKM
jgi:thiamine-phosphate pyrophosphorylase